MSDQRTFCPLPLRNIRSLSHLQLDIRSLPGRSARRLHLPPCHHILRERRSPPGHPSEQNKRALSTVTEPRMKVTTGIRTPYLPFVSRPLHRHPPLL